MSWTKVLIVFQMTIQASGRLGRGKKKKNDGFLLVKEKL